MTLSIARGAAFGARVGDVAECSKRETVGAVELHQPFEVFFRLVVVRGLLVGPGADAATALEFGRAVHERRRPAGAAITHLLFMQTPARRSRTVSAVVISNESVRRNDRDTFRNASAASLLPVSARALPVSGCQYSSARITSTACAAASAEAP